MVDVAFLLLTFFMVTTAFRRPQTIEITLPKEALKRREIQVQESNILQIAVTERHELFFKSGGDALKPTDPNNLFELFIDESERNLKRNEGAAFKDRYRLIVVVKLEPKCRYEMLVHILDDLNQAVDSLNTRHRLSDPGEQLFPRFTITRLTERDPLWPFIPHKQ